MLLWRPRWFLLSHRMDPGTINSEITGDTCSRPKDEEIAGEDHMTW